MPQRLQTPLGVQEEGVTGGDPLLVAQSRRHDGEASVDPAESHGPLAERAVRRLHQHVWAPGRVQKCASGDDKARARSRFELHPADLARPKLGNPGIEAEADSRRGLVPRRRRLGRRPHRDARGGRRGPEEQAPLPGPEPRRFVPVEHRRHPPLGLEPGGSPHLDRKHPSRRAGDHRRVRGFSRDRWNRRLPWRRRADRFERHPAHRALLGPRRDDLGVHGTGVTLRSIARSIVPLSGNDEGRSRCEPSQQQQDQPSDQDQRRRGARRARLLPSLRLHRSHVCPVRPRGPPGTRIPGGLRPETGARTP